jgi:O-antigen ligase
MLLFYGLTPFSVERLIHGIWITSADLFVVAALVWWVIRGKSLKNNSFPLLPIVAALLFTFLISGFNALNTMLYVKEFVKYIFIFGLFYASVNNCDNEEFLKNIPLLISLSALVESLWYIHDFLSTGAVMLNTDKMWVRSYLNAQHLNLLGAFLCLTIPFGLYYVITKRALKYKILAAAAVLAEIIALFLTYSRGSWVGALVSLPIIFIYWRKNTIRGVLLFLLLAVVPFVSVAHFIPKLQLQERFISMFNSQEGSIVFRKAFINAAIALIKQHPFIGIGLGNFQVASDKILHVFVLKMVHNMFLQCAVEAGIPSLALMLLLIFMYFYDSFKIIGSLNNYNNYKWLLICAMASFTGLIVSSQFGDPFIRYIKEYFALLLALPYAVQRHVQRNTP